MVGGQGLSLNSQFVTQKPLSVSFSTFMCGFSFFNTKLSNKLIQTALAGKMLKLHGSGSR